MTPPWLHEGAPFVWRPYCQHQTAPPPLPVVAARGSRLWLADGTSLVDGIASWWTAAHGYQHPHLVDAIQRQAGALAHVAFGGLAHAPAFTLARRLAALLPPPLSRVFFVESGSVAVEVALKMALQAAHQRGETARRDVIAFAGAYHGDTFATMALADAEDGMHAAFAGRAPFSVHALPLPPPEPEGAEDTDDGRAFDARFAALATTTAAAVIEPLFQGASAMRFYAPARLRRLRRLCTRHGVTLVFDEIATGFFRLGPRFATDELAAVGVVPDVVVVGKALTGGTLPLAAAIASEALFADFLDDDGSHALQHGPTYMANALACAAAHASLDLFDATSVDERRAQVERLSARMLAALAPFADHAGVVDVRGRGGVAVVELPPGTAPPSAAFAARGAFVRPLRLPRRDLVYLMPPLAIDDDDLAALLAAVTGTLSASLRS